MAYRAYGIDLGNSSTKVAVVNDRNEAVRVRSLIGEDATPSAVYIEPDGTAIIGDEAASALLADPISGTDAVKSALGADSYRRLGGHLVSPEQVAALFLSEVVSVASTDLGRQLRRVVLTAPVTLGSDARRALIDAVIRAELEIVAVLAEPVAVAFSIGNLTNADETVLICDVGSTVTTTILKISPGAVDIVAADGTTATGGDAWSTALIDLVIDKFVEQTVTGFDPRDDAEFMVELLYDIENKKRSLSRRSDIAFRCRAGHYDERVTVTRAEFEAATEHLALELVSVVERTLAQGTRQEPGLTIDRFLLAGGAARMPMITDRLRGRGFNPLPTDFECAASKGAAIYGEFLHQAAPIEVRYTAPSLRGTESAVPDRAPTDIRPQQPAVEIREPANEAAAERFHRLELEISDLRRANAILRSTITHLIDRIGGHGDYPTSTP